MHDGCRQYSVVYTLRRPLRKTYRLNRKRHDDFSLRPDVRMGGGALRKRFVISIYKFRNDMSFCNSLGFRSPTNYMSIMLIHIMLLYISTFLRYTVLPVDKPEETILSIILCLIFVVTKEETKKICV